MSTGSCVCQSTSPLTRLGMVDACSNYNAMSYASHAKSKQTTPCCLCMPCHIAISVLAVPVHCLSREITGPATCIGPATCKFVYVASNHSTVLCLFCIPAAMHDLDPVFRAYARCPRFNALLRSLGYKRPLLIQSMYIFKVGRGSLRQHAPACHDDAQIGVLLADHTCEGRLSSMPRHQHLCTTNACGMIHHNTTCCC